MQMELKIKTKIISIFFQNRTEILNRRELNLVNAPLEEGLIIADNCTTSSIMNEIWSFSTIQYS